MNGIKCLTDYFLVKKIICKALIYEMYLASQEMPNSLLILFFFVFLLCNALKRHFERLE
jgi:hypothetical protein